MKKRAPKGPVRGLAKDEEGLRIAEIDCNLYAGLCQEEGASVYPTLLYYRQAEYFLSN